MQSRIFSASTILFLVLLSSTVFSQDEPSGPSESPVDTLTNRRDEEIDFDRECLATSELSSGLNLEQLQEDGYELLATGYYFCADTAPAKFRCKCASSSICVPKIDPFGRDIGACGCCPGWVWGVLGILGFAILVGIIFCMYACCCRGRWWCDGHPPAIQPILPRRGAPMVVPGSMPLPRQLFRGYRPRDFESGLPPGVPQERPREEQQQQQQQQGARSSSGNNGANPSRRRRSEARDGTSEELSPLTHRNEEAGAEEEPSSPGPAFQTAGSGGRSSQPRPVSRGREEGATQIQLESASEQEA